MAALFVFLVYLVAYPGTSTEGRDVWQTFGLGSIAIQDAPGRDDVLLDAPSDCRWEGGDGAALGVEAQGGRLLMRAPDGAGDHKTPHR